jgi:hypothetical protein
VQTQDAVELSYRLTREDLLEGFVAQHRSARRPWHLRWPSVALLIAIGALVYVAVVAGLLPVWALAITVPPVALAVLLAMPRRLYGRAVGQLMRANPAVSQPMTAIVSPAGIRTTTAIGETVASWAQYPYHAETDRVFALFASDRLGGAVLVLPKRAVPDSEPLRALLGSCSRRLGPAGTPG